jgi:probable selenium-dependent hydroxylase accessory protein YqeC
VLVTTTTHVGRSIAERLPTVALSDHVAPGLPADEEAPGMSSSGRGRGGDDDVGPGARAVGSLRAAIEAALSSDGRVFLAGGVDRDGKFFGVDPALLDSLRRSVRLDAVLVEADGSRQRPLKAPAAHEPVVPVSTELLVPVAGLDAIGRPFGPDVVHRHEVAAGIAPGTAGRGEPVTAELVSALLGAPDGGLKSAPPGARVRAVLNKSLEASESDALRAAKLLLESAAPRIDRVLITDVRAGRFGYVAAE